MALSTVAFVGVWGSRFCMTTFSLYHGTHTQSSWHLFCFWFSHCFHFTFITASAGATPNCQLGLANLKCFARLNIRGLVSDVPYLRSSTNLFKSARTITTESKGQLPTELNGGHLVTDQRQVELGITNPDRCSRLTSVRAGFNYTLSRPNLYAQLAAARNSKTKAARNRIEMYVVVMVVWHALDTRMDSVWVSVSETRIRNQIHLTRASLKHVWAWLIRRGGPYPLLFQFSFRPRLHTTIRI